MIALGMLVLMYIFLAPFVLWALYAVAYGLFGDLIERRAKANEIRKKWKK